MRRAAIIVALGSTFWAAPAAAHHVVSTSGIAWVEPLTVAEVDFDVAAFDFGGELRGDWQGLAVRGEFAPIEPLSLSIRVPWAHVRLADGRGAIGLSDIEGSVKLRVYETEHGGLLASVGVGTGLPTGDPSYGLGAGHYELAPFAAVSTNPTRHLVVDGLATHKMSLGGDAGESTDGTHGALTAPHAKTESLFRVGAAGVLDRWYARAGAEGVIAWSSPMDSLAASIDVGFALPGRLRLSIGGSVPVAGTQRYRWRTRASAAVQFQ